MKIAGFFSTEVNNKSCDSINELRTLLDDLGSTIILGDDEEGLNHFSILTFECFNFHIGVCSSQNGYFSGCSKFGDNVLIYNDQMVYLVAKDSNVVWEFRNDGIVYEILIREKEVVVIHEIGINCINLGGNIVWNYFTDIIVSFKVNNNILWIKTYDEKEKNISLISGLVV